MREGSYERVVSTIATNELSWRRVRHKKIRHAGIREMSENNTDSKHRTESTIPIGRRQFLAASGLVCGSNVGGLDGATPSDASHRTGRGRRRDPAGFTRYELSDHGLGNAQTDTPPFCPRVTIVD